MRLSSKVTLITGAASGIGRASALLFSREGATVVVADIDEKGGQETVDAIQEQGGKALFTQTDITKAQDMERMVQTTVSQFGKLDVLFNNAGVGTSFFPLEQVEDDYWDKIMAINTKSVYLGCKYAIPIMKEQGSGAIIMTASISGTRPRPGLVLYSTSKGAVITFTKALAIELAPFNIRVNCINPVVTETAFLDKTIEPDKMAEAKKAMSATIPLGRMGQPEDMAAAALYLASDESSLVTGVNLDVDGGRGI